MERKMIEVIETILDYGGSPNTVISSQEYAEQDDKGKVELLKEYADYLTKVVDADVECRNI
jgi:hypothetical protein